MNSNIWKKIAWIDDMNGPNPCDMPGQHVFVVQVVPYQEFLEVFADGDRWQEVRYGINYDDLLNFDYWCTREEFFKSFKEEQAK